MIADDPSPSAPDPSVPPRRDGVRVDVGVLVLCAGAAVGALLPGRGGAIVTAFAVGAIALLTVVDLGRRVLARRPPAGAAPAPDDDLPGTDDHAGDLAARSRFLAMAAHEIRTPLGGIVGLADLLGRTPLTAEQATYVTAVRSSGGALLDLVDGLLDTTRLEAGHVSTSLAAVSLEALAEDVVELLAPRAQAKGLEIATHVAPDLPASVAADAALLRQVLINLVGNAVKYTETGGVAVEIAHARADPPERIGFRVRDTGIGIAAADADRIFGEWERVAGPDRPRGTGLGLAIARSIVERLGGRIRVDSRPGEGSTFSFAVDLATVTPAPPLEPELVGRRVLVLSRGVIEPPLLARRLHALGAEVVLTDRVEAVDGDFLPDLVLVDIHGDDPAEGDAVAVLTALRRRIGVVPAVVLVTPNERGDLARFRREGFDGHLVKPVRRASLARLAATLTGADAGPRGAPAPAAATADAAWDALLVDDNEINALLGRTLLEHLGLSVKVVADGPAALAALDGRRHPSPPPVLVVMDLHMPGMDGFAAIRAIRKREDGDSRLLIVAATADATSASAAAARAAGADAVLVKPIDRDVLAALLATVPTPRRNLG